MSSYGKYSKTDKNVWPSTVFGDDKGFTVQADRDEADINKIVARFEKSGTPLPVVHGEPFYGDVSMFGDLAESLIQIQEADRLFMSFPANVRERFHNDKVEFVDFLADEANREEAIKLGLIQKAPDPEPVPPTPPPAGG